MLARHYTLKTTKDFTRVKKNGKAYRSKSFTVYYVPQDNPATSRFGFIISTKISKKASLRNRARRVLADGVRFSCTELKDGFDSLFVAKPTIIKTYTADLIKEVRKTLEEIDLIKK